MKHKTTKLICLLSCLCITLSLLSGCNSATANDVIQSLNDKYATSTDKPSTPAPSDPSDTLITTNGFDLSQIPEYTGNPIYEYNNNQAMFTSDEITDVAYETYYDLDDIGRVQGAEACLGEETLPTEPRGEIGSVKPTGWHSVKYDCVDGKYLYNRCHLIAYELSAENANEKNLTTGTRYMNVSAMLPYENMTRAYIDDTGNHVMYRVTPMFIENELLCRGVLIEAYSVEDNGAGLQFCVYCYNVQPYITIDYTTGDSYLSEETPDDDIVITPTNSYVLNTNSKTVHKPDCSSVSKISSTNKKEYTGSLSDILNEGYKTCGICKPE